MKKFAVLTLILVAAMIIPNIVGAQGEDLPGSGWWTGQQIMNIGTADATISSTAYAKDGTATYVANADSLVKPGASVTFLPDQFSGMQSGFIGSAVVSSDQPIKAIVNLSNRKIGNYGVDGGAAFGQYQGMDGTAAATTLRFPLAKNDWANKTNTFFIQNAGTAPATFHIAYVCKDSAGTVSNFTEDSASVEVGRMAVMGPANVATMPKARLCAATVTSTQAMAGVATEHWTTESPATLVQALRAFTPNDYAPVVYAPLFKEQFPKSATQNRTTGAQIMNVGTAAVSIKATFYGSMGATEACPSGQEYTVTANNVNPGDSANFLHPSVVPVNCLASAKFEVVGGTGSIVGVINESYLNPVPAKGAQAATAYNLAPSTSATKQVVFPLFKEKFAGKTTGLQVQNVGTAEATIHVVFKSGTNTWTTNDQKVKAGASWNFLQVSSPGGWGTWNGTAMPAGTNAGATIISDQPILGYASESPYPSCYATPGCFDKSNYEGFNVNP